ncbi:hypothetical protein Hanom_Chr04g00385581 [Helianthus anomalus]
MVPAVSLRESSPPFEFHSPATLSVSFQPSPDSISVFLVSFQ